MNISGDAYVGGGVCDGQSSVLRQSTAVCLAGDHVHRGTVHRGLLPTASLAHHLRLARPDHATSATIGRIVEDSVRSRFCAVSSEGGRDQ